MDCDGARQSAPASAAFCCSGVGMSGSVTTKRVPSSSRVPSTQMRPPCPSTMPREMARPSPVPPTLRVFDDWICSNLSKTRSRSCSAIEMPLFQIDRPTKLRDTWGPKMSTSIRPPSGVNLIAFDRRLLSTCVSRSASPTMRTSPSAGARTPS